MIPEPKEKPQSLRNAIVGGVWGAADLGRHLVMTRGINGNTNTLNGIVCLIWYGCQCKHGGKRRMPVDVTKMIQDWVEWVAKFSTAHDKKDIDEKEFEIDVLLSPLLTAPVKQLREFYSGLCDALEKDERIPFFVWKSFKAYGTVVVDKAQENASILRLKKKLASEIADIVEQEETIKIDLHKALVGALQWRGPENLKEIKEDLEAGAKPKLKGRQSCLFLTAKRKGKPEHSVML